MLKTESRQGYLKVDNETVEYWTRSGPVRIPLGIIFGAGPDKGTFREILRICVITDHKSGFGFKLPSFEGYRAESGPARRIVGTTETGNIVARKTIIYHIM